MTYLSYSDYCKAKFGCKVYKLSIDAGFTCPNRDGTCGTGGCVFCSGRGSGDFAAAGTSVTAQLEAAKARVASKNKGGKYIAYFQAFTNTYAPVDKLRELYEEAMASEEIVGLAIGTRPDCLPEDVVALLEELNRIKPISVELGLQTIHEESVKWIQRGYETPVYDHAVRRLKTAGLEVVTHIILGLPGETAELAAQTTAAAVAAGTDGVKFHLLHVLRGTKQELYFLNRYEYLLSLEEYGRWLLACLAQVPPHVVVHRITGDGAKKDLIAPLWSANKKHVLNYLRKLIAEAPDPAVNFPAAGHPDIDTLQTEENQ